MTWQILITISIVLSSITAILQRKMLNSNKSDPVAYSVFFQLSIALLLLIYGLFIKDINFSNLNRLAINLVVLAVLYGLGNIGIFTSLKYTEASKFTVIFSSRALFSAIGFSLILGDSLSLLQYLGIVLLAVAVIVINLGEFTWKIQKGDLYALLAGLSFGIASINDKVLLENVSLYTFLFLAFFIPPLLVILLRPKTFSDFKTVLNKDTLKVMLSTIAAYTIGAITFFTALKIVDSPSKVTTVNLSGVILTVILGIIFLNERKNILFKVAGTVLAVIGLYLIV